MHRNWRDCKEWELENLPLSTTNNQTAKLYDATLTQYVGWYDDQSFGGLDATIKKLLESDPDFVMGHVLSNGLELLGTGRSPALDPEFKSTLDKMVEMASTAKITNREKLHVEALKEYMNGNMTGACAKWEEITFSHPTDMQALKFAHDTYFFLGRQSQMRDSVARAMKSWHHMTPLYGYLKGMYSFGLVECNFYEHAERVAKEGLSMNPKDGWCTHSLAHVHEMTGRYKEGIRFMSSTVKEWEVKDITQDNLTCGMLACHNFWHWALFHLEKGEQKCALDIYDSEMIKRGQKSGAMIDIVDTASLLFRLEMEGANVGDRWSDLFELTRPHAEDHLAVFNDVHLLMSYLGANKDDVTSAMMETVKTFIASGEGDQRSVMEHVGEQLMRSVQAYTQGEYAKCVDLLNPLRYKILQIGGSNAQRDVFNLLLINAALQSTSDEHHIFARHLLWERKALRENSPMTDRLIARTTIKHQENNSH